MHQPDIFLRLPWPDRALSPNERNHWTERQSFKHKAKSSGFLAAKQFMQVYELMPGDINWMDYLEVTYVFYAPDAKRRDIDNLLASMKPTQDGVFEGFSIDDSKIKRCVVELDRAPDKQACVMMRIKPCQIDTDVQLALL